MSLILGITGTLAEGYWTSPLYFFQNGKWKNLTTTGLTKVSGGRCNMKLYNSKIYFYLNSTTDTTSYWRTNQTINFSSYNYLKIIGLSSSDTMGISTSSSTTSFSASVVGANSGTAILNISSISGNYYIYFKINLSGGVGDTYISELFVSNS